jgi:hypothetical protein
MELITLNPIPSQAFTVSLGGNNYAIKIYSIDGHTAYDLSVNDKVIVTGFKMVNDIPLMPYDYQEVNGNILLSLPEAEIPDYSRFGISQFLYYLNAEETAAYRLAANL